MLIIGQVIGSCVELYKIFREAIQEEWKYNEEFRREKAIRDKILEMRKEYANEITIKPKWGEWQDYGIFSTEGKDWEIVHEIMLRAVCFCERQSAIEGRKVREATYEDICAVCEQYGWYLDKDAEEVAQAAGAFVLEF